MALRTAVLAIVCALALSQPSCDEAGVGSRLAPDLPGPSADTVSLYGVFELRVRNGSDYRNPYDYREIELRGRFESPRGDTTTFFGFHDGNGEGGVEGEVWRLRFRPDETGTWSYEYWWTDGNPGGRGTFVVEDDGAPAPLRVDPETPRFFETARGEPFHFRGYDLHVMAPYLPTGSLRQNRVRIDSILGSLAGRGVNFTMLDGAIRRRSGGPNLWEESWWEGPDLSRFDPATWKAFEDVLWSAHRYGIYALTFAGMVYQGDQYPFEDFQLFLRYWVARLGPFSNFLGYSPTWEWTDIWSVRQVDRIMAFVDEIHPFEVPLTVHDCSHPTFEGWLDFSMRQAHVRTLSGANDPRTGQARGPCPQAVADVFADRPILGSEDIWEVRQNTAGWPRNRTEVRRAAWGEMMAGVLPLYSDWHPAPPPRGGEGSGFDDVRRMFEFIYSETRYRRYQQLNQLVFAGDRQVASGVPGREYLVYDESGGEVALDLSEVESERTFAILWYDPTTGQSRMSGSVSAGSVVQLESPYGGDSVLLLRVREAP